MFVPCMYPFEDSESSDLDKNDVYREKKKKKIDLESVCRRGDIDTIEEYLKDHDINTILKEGCTLLLIAASYYEEELIEYLLDRGADATIHNYDGYTPLMALCESAKMRDYSNCSSLLIEVSNVDATDNRKMTALMYACKKGKIELVKQLIKHTKNINAEDIRGCTALFHAVLSEKIEVVKLLVDNKADTAIMNNENRTAEKVADSKGYHQISSFLSNEIDKPLNYKILSNINWRYQFHRLFSMEDHCVNYDIYDYLNQLNLKCYVTFFRKMKLQIFLQLTEEDLINLKMNISVHRNRFLEFLNQFHCKPWDKMSLHLNLYGSPYTFYNGLTCVSTVANQIIIMTSTFHYIKRNVNNHFFENMFINDAQISEYINTLKSTEKELVNIKKRLLQLKTLAKKINRENSLMIPPSYIGPKVTKNFYFKPIILSILLVCGMYLTKVQVYK